MRVMDCGAIYDRFRKTGGLNQLPMCRETYKSTVFHEIRCSCCMRSGSLPPHVIFRGAGEELADVADGAVQDALAAFDGAYTAIATSNIQKSDTTITLLDIQHTNTAKVVTTEIGHITLIK